MEKIFIYLTNLSSNVAYLAVFGILIACGVGFPLPEDIPLIATGYLVWDGTMELWLAFAVTMLGVLIGDSILFYLGSQLGMKFLNSKRVSTMFSPEKIKRVQAYFRKYGDKIVFFARFVAGFRAAAFFMAGSMGMRYTRFILLDGIAALLSVPIWIGIGYGLGHYLGEEIHQILLSIKHLKAYFTAGVFLIIAFVCIRAYVKYRKAAKTNKAAGATRAA